MLPSLVVGDGSGAAEIAAAQVTPIVGTGSETQFQFQGTISSQKPFRDLRAKTGKLKGAIDLLEWRNWQTHGTQNPATFTGHEGSTPSSSTIIAHLRPHHPHPSVRD